MQASGAMRREIADTHHLSSSALCAIAHSGGRSSIPETSMIEPTGPGVLDTPPSRGKTISCSGRYPPVIASERSNP
jgi:hypothetical protein